MSEQYVAAIDQGTASSRCMVFDRTARIVSVAQKEHEQIFPRPGWVEHDPEEIWRNVVEVVQGALDNASLQPSDLVALGIANQRESTIVWERDDGRAGAQRHQLAGHAHRPDHPRAGRRRRPGPLPRALRAAAGHLLLGPQAALAARHRAGPARARRGRRGALRDDGLVADLEAHRPPPHRRHQRQPDHAHGPGDARLGRRAARRDGRPAGDAARDPALVGGLRRGGRTAGRRPRRLGAGRPAGRAVRADVLLARRGQVHLRDRQLPALQHRRAAGPVGQRPADHGLLSHRRRGADLRARGLDRGHRRARAVVPRQHHPDRLARPRSRRWRARSTTTAAATSSPPSPGSSRRTGAATRAASSPG